jgi:MFS family permease
VLKSGLFTAIPGIAMFVGEVTVGGMYVDHLIRKGHDASLVRKSVLVIGILIAFFTVGAGTSTTPVAAITWIALGSVGIALVYVVSNSIPALIAPEGDTGSVAAIMNFVNLLAGMISPIVTGEIVDATGNFKYAFLVGGIALIGGLLSFVFLMGKIEPIPSRTEAEAGTHSEHAKLGVGSRIAE